MDKVLSSAELKSSEQNTLENLDHLNKTPSVTSIDENDIEDEDENVRIILNDCKFSNDEARAYELGKLNFSKNVEKKRLSLQTEKIFDLKSNADMNDSLQNKDIKNFELIKKLLQNATFQFF